MQLHNEVFFLQLQEDIFLIFHMLDAFFVVDILFSNALQGPELLTVLFCVHNHEVDMAVLPSANAHSTIIIMHLFLCVDVNRLIS